jgi:hypothetical protein
LIGDANVSVTCPLRWSIAARRWAQPVFAPSLLCVLAASREILRFGEPRRCARLVQSSIGPINSHAKRGQTRKLVHGPNRAPSPRKTGECQKMAPNMKAICRKSLLTKEIGAKDPAKQCQKVPESATFYERVSTRQPVMRRGKRGLHE